MNRRRAWLWLQRLARWVLGGLFVYAGIVKMLGMQTSAEWSRPAVAATPSGQVAHPPASSLTVTLKFLGPAAFRDEIRNYRLGPLYWIVHPTAIVLPWIEIITGLALIFGVWVVESAVMIIAMLLVFNLGVGSAMYRGLDIKCGCFGGDMKVGWLKITENLLLVALGAAAIVGRWRVRALDRARREGADGSPAAFRVSAGGNA